MKKRNVLIVLPAALLLASSLGLAALQVGDPAPDFSIPDTAWVNRQLTEWRGKVVLLNFWQSG